MASDSVPASGFRENGFLEASESPRIATIRERHAPWFAFVEKLNCLAMTVLLREAPKVNDEVYLGTLYARSVTMFQGAVRLAERGLAAESRTLVRGCAETAIALGCVRRDKSFFDRLDEDYDKHRIALAKLTTSCKGCPRTIRTFPQRSAASCATSSPSSRRSTSDRARCGLIGPTRRSRRA